MTSPASLHSAGSSEWYTPQAIIESAREWMGGIDLDPASCDVAQEAVQARDYYHERGLEQPWAGRVWLNPPSPPKRWWKRLVEQHRAGAVPQAVYLAYSLEQLQQSQLWGAPMTSFHVCLPRRRVAFLASAPALAKKHQERARALRSRATTPSGGSQPDTDRRNARWHMVKAKELRALDPYCLVPGEQPSHASAIVGLGGDGAEFARIFREHGAVMWRKRA